MSAQTYKENKFMNKNVLIGTWQYMRMNTVCLFTLIHTQFTQVGPVAQLI
jgi:hypothetical protein